MKSIAVFCGANAGTRPIFRDTCVRLGQLFASKNIRLVYGGGSVGLMNIMANAVLDAGGTVTGVIPTFLAEKEVANEQVTELIKVASMHERKTIMYERSEGVITLPGGFGTMDELCEMLTWSQLGLHNKPIGILNVDGYYNGLIQLFDSMVKEGFLKQENRSLALFSDSIDELIPLMENIRPLNRDQWMSKTQDT